jgi:hypothetical protein
MALKRWAATVSSGTVNTDIELMEAHVGEETVIFSLLVSNYGVETANIGITHTNTDGVTPIFEWGLIKTAAESPTAITSAIVLEAGDRLLFRADKPGVSFLASGEAR